MSLATRCPSCETVFRVVPDQLRVSDGWVRCGRCSEVFNASRNLVDTSAVEPEPRRAPIAVRSGVPAAAGEALPGSPPAQAPLTHADIDISLPPAPSGAEPGGAVIGGEPEPAPTPTPDDIEAELRDILARRAAGSGNPPPAPRAEPPLDDLRADEPPLFADPADAVRAPAPTPAAATSATPASTPATTPSFVRQAERAARWQRPGMRLALGTTLLLALALLAGQALYTWRDQAAARWPEFRPLLAEACARLGCRVEALRAIDALSVESSGLLRVEKSEVYKLAVTLRNQRAYEVALPALEVSLTDTQGRLIARKVLRAGELGAAGASVAGHSDLALQGNLQVAASTPGAGSNGAALVAGYTIELFYP
jgi:predicted Zn finger-like uncharacterized protein